MPICFLIVYYVSITWTLFVF